MEAGEVHELQENQEHGASESALRPVAFTMSVVAVLVAVTTVLGHRTHTEAVLNQNKATDQWNEYQAKKIRESTNDVAVNTPIATILSEGEDASAASAPAVAKPAPQTPLQIACHARLTAGPGTCAGSVAHVHRFSGPLVFLWWPFCICLVVPCIHFDSLRVCFSRPTMSFASRCHNLERG